MCDSSSSPHDQTQRQDHQSLLTQSMSAAIDDEIPQNQQNPLSILQQQAEEQEQQGMASSLTDLSVSVDFPDPITDAHVSYVGYVTTPTLRRFPSKRKKGKANIKKQQAIEKKYQSLIDKLNPIPFSPSKILDFAKHEKLLRRLGLWEFVRIEFDKSIRVELIAQLVASYDPKLRCSYVNEHRIAVNRADLARAFKLPVKKEKGSGGSVVVDGVELDSGEVLVEEDSIGLIEDFVSNWVLLHEDTWMMPSEVLNWMKVIKDGHPEKVDWAGLFWFMVEKELMQGEQLEDCYYASHLQYLIKSQREEVLAKGGPEKVELDAEEKDEEDGANEVDLKAGDAINANEGQEEGVGLERPNIELTLGQDGREKEEGAEKGGTENTEMMDHEEGNEVGEDEEQQQWLADGKDKVNEQFLQCCNMEGSRELDDHEGSRYQDEEIEEEDREEEAEDGFDVVPNDDTLEGEGLTGNFLQALETTQMEYSSQENLHDQSSMELLPSESKMQQATMAGPSFYENGSKREIEHNLSMSNHSLSSSAKRLRIDGPWDNKPSDFGACVEQMHQLMTRARMLYEAKEQAEEQSNMNQQILLSELQKRDNMINHLHKSKCEEVQKRDDEIFRLERELSVMESLVEAYRKALKETQKAFAEYRQHCQLPEEPIYKDAGHGGLMLSSAEIERRRLKEEEEHRLNCLMLEQKANEALEEHVTTIIGKVRLLDKRLEGLENEFQEMKQLKDLHYNHKGSEAEEQVSRNPESPANE